MIGVLVTGKDHVRVELLRLGNGHHQAAVAIGLFHIIRKICIDQHDLTDAVFDEKACLTEPI